MSQTENPDVEEARKALEDVDDGKEKILAVDSYSYSDKHSGHSFRGAVYWNYEKERWDTIQECRCGEQAYEFVDAPEEHQERWDERQERKRQAKRALDNIIDKLKTTRNCPVCGGDLYSVDNEWVRRKIHRQPDYVDRPDPVRYCADCGANLWKGNGNFNVSVRIGMNAIDEGSDVSASKYVGGALSQDATRKVKMRNPEKYTEPLEDFWDGLQDLREQEGVDADRGELWP